MDWQIVLPGYFEAMHTPLLAGRADNAPDRTGVVINEILAHKSFSA